MIIHYADGYWGVQSSKKKIIYLIYWAKSLQRWICTCPDFEYRKVSAGKDCKHIKMLRNFLESASIEKLAEVKANGSTKL